MEIFVNYLVEISKSCMFFKLNFFFMVCIGIIKIIMMVMLKKNFKFVLIEKSCMFFGISEIIM